MPAADTYLQGRLALRVVLVFGAAYFLSYAFRAINAVIAPALMGDLQLSNADLGLLSSAYFVGFASLQLPLGIWLDKYGPRRTEASLLLFAALGAAIFASSDTLAGLWVGRALIGVGVSACLMAPYKAYRSWYPPERQSQLASWMLVFGTAGALATTVPVAEVLGLSVSQASQVLFVFNFCLMLSYLALSWWAPRHVSYGQSRGWPALKVVGIGIGLSILLQLAMLLLPYTWAWLLWLPFALLVTVSTLAQTHVSLSFPSAQAGRVNSAYNLTLFIGAFGVQWGLGLLIDLFVAYGWETSPAIRMAWFAYLLVQLFALLRFVSSKALVTLPVAVPATR